MEFEDGSNMRKIMVDLLKKIAGRKLQNSSLHFSVYKSEAKTIK